MHLLLHVALLPLLFPPDIALARALPIPNCPTHGKTRIRDLIYDTECTYHSGYWPIYRTRQYEPVDSTPGGPIRTLLIFTVDPRRHTSDRYRLTGDQYSLDTVRLALRTGCSIASSLHAVSSNDPNLDDPFHTLPHIQSVVQFYRANSFALSLDGYNNSATPTMPAISPNNTSQAAPLLQSLAPLPADINRSFLRCINETVGASLPLFSPGSIHFTTNDGGAEHALPLRPFILMSTALFTLLLNWLFPSSKEVTDPWLGRLGHLATFAALW